MLDKSIPFKHVIMRIDAADLALLPNPRLPEGFSFRFFQPGDEIAWGRIEQSVGEFKTQQEATQYFERDYLPFQQELSQRLVMVVNPKNDCIATANAWFANSSLGYQASLHWVAVQPEYQGMGIGKAVVLKALHRLKQTDANQDVWLHTQTWSHVAIQLYHQLGFRILKKSRTAVEQNTPAGVLISPNDYEDAIAVLSKIYEPDILTAIISRARV